MSSEDGLFYNDHTKDSFIINQQPDKKTLDAKICVPLFFSLESSDSKKGFFQNSLVDQFKKMMHNTNIEFQLFLRSRLLSKLHSVHISYPNIIRNEGTEEGSFFFRNIAIRIYLQDEEMDFVLVGDVKRFNSTEREFNNIPYFYVKEILLMDPNIGHIGEITIDEVAIALCIGEGNWEPPIIDDNELDIRNLIRNIAFTYDFMNGLMDEYIIDDQLNVQKKLQLWKEYIDSRNHLIDVEEKNECDLSICEVISAFYTPILPNEDPTDDNSQFKDAMLIDHLGVVKQNNRVWTYDKVNDDQSKACVLIHIAIDKPWMYIPQDKTDKDIKKEIDGLTNGSLIIVKPNDKIKTDSDLHKKRPDIIYRINNGTRIKSTETEEVLPETINEINKKYDGKIDIFKNEKAKELEIITKRKLSEYEQKELPAIIESYVSAESEQLRKRNETKMAKSLVKEKEALKKKFKSDPNRLNSELEKLAKKYDVELKVQEEFEKKKMKWARELLNTKDGEFKKELREKIDSEVIDYITDIDQQRMVEITRERNSKGLTRYHAFYECEISDSEDVDSKVKELSDKFKTEKLSLKKNLIGDRKIAKRQEESIDNLLKGNSVNPYLATALFSPRSMGDIKVKNVGSFYLENLNPSQKNAIEKALSSNGVFLIQGPPGTGKTQVIAELTTQFVLSGKKVIIASETHKAVDNAFSRLPKIPNIRPLRLFSDASTKKGDNEHNQSNLTINLYNSITESLNKEIEKYKNHAKYEKELDDQIISLETMLQEINHLINDAKNIQNNIDEIQAEINSLNESINKNNEIDQKIMEEIEKKIQEKDKIKSFSDEEFIPVIIEKIKNECGYDASTMDSYSLSTMYNNEINELFNEYDLYVEHETLFELKSELSMKTNTEEKIELNKNIHEYEDENGVYIKKDFPILSLFENRVPDIKTIRDIMVILSKTVDEKIRKIDNSIYNRKSMLMTNDTETKNRRISSLKAEIRQYEYNPVYKKLDKKIIDFNKCAHSIINDLKLQMYDTPDEAIEIIRSGRAKLSREFSTGKSEYESRINVFREITDYLIKRMGSEDMKAESILYNPYLVGCANVFGITCSSDNKFKNEFDEDKDINLTSLNIDVVIIDEASKIALPEIIRPCLLGKTIIIVGDHKQLPPVYADKVDENEFSKYDPRFINSEKENKFKSMYEDHSFFEEMFLRTPDNCKTMLTRQYRMHRQIMDVDNVFYGGKLECGCKDSEKLHRLVINGTNGIPIVSEKNHILFINYKGHYQKTESGENSIYNDKERDIIVDLIKKIDSNCRFDTIGNELKTPSKGSTKDTRLSIGIICTYRKQAIRINTALKEEKKKFKSFNTSHENRLQISTVDDFQGDERDIIILSMVRTDGKSGFLKNYHRINVAVSRARRLLIIVGNGSFLSGLCVNIDGEEKYVYREIIESIQNRDGVIDSKLLGGEVKE